MVQGAAEQRPPPSRQEPAARRFSCESPRPQTDRRGSGRFDTGRFGLVWAGLIRAVPVRARTHPPTSRRPPATRRLSAVGPDRVDRADSRAKHEHRRPVIRSARSACSPPSCQWAEGPGGQELAGQRRRRPPAVLSRAAPRPLAAGNVLGLDQCTALLASSALRSFRHGGKHAETGGGALAMRSYPSSFRLESRRLRHRRFPWPLGVSPSQRPAIRPEVRSG